MLNIVICDDDKAFADKLFSQVSEIVSKTEYEYNIHRFYKGTDMLKHCEKNLTDIILVDIDMPKMNGFEAVRSLQAEQPDLAIIFVTSHEELAYQAYDYQPFWFVSKRNLEKLDEVINKLIMKLRFSNESNQIFHLRLDFIIDINVNEVMYLKGDRHYISAVKENGDVQNFRCKLKDAYEQLKQVGFIYVQRSYIVNCRFIQKLEYKYVTLKNGEKISVTRNKEMMREAQRLFGKFMRELRW